MLSLLGFLLLGELTDSRAHQAGALHPQPQPHPAELGGRSQQEILMNRMSVCPLCLKWRLPASCSWARLVPEPPQMAYLFSREEKPGQTDGCWVWSGALLVVMDIKGKSVNIFPAQRPRVRIPGDGS